MQKAKPSTGRSMIEILGVLSVVGILSVLIVSMLPYLFSKKSANDVWYEVMLRATAVITNRHIFEELPLNSVFDSGELSSQTESGYPIETQKNADDGFVVYVSNVQNKVCKRILELENKMVYRLTVDVGSGEVDYKVSKDICSQTQVMGFYFTMEAVENLCPPSHPQPVNCKTTPGVDERGCQIYLYDCQEHEKCINYSLSECQGSESCMGGICCGQEEYYDDTASKCCMNARQEYYDETSCMTRYVPASLNSCPSYQYACSSSESCSHQGCCPSERFNLLTRECCEQGSLYQSASEMCCPLTPEGYDETACMTKLLLATPGVCAHYVSACGTDEHCSEGVCCPSGTNYDKTAGLCCSDAEESYQADTCMTKLVPSTSGSCAYYTSSCTTDQICSQGHCCANGLLYDSVAGKCCPAAPEGYDETACITQLVPSSAGVCAYYTEKCNKNNDEVCLPDGTCTKCHEVTASWFASNEPPGKSGGTAWTSYSSGDKTGDTRPVWYCNYWKVMSSSTGTGEHWYNPSTQSYCNYREVLRLTSSGTFECDNCGGFFKEGGLGTAWGWCGCGDNYVYDASTKTCKSPCSNGYTQYGPECIPCDHNTPTTDGKTCLAANVCDPSIPAWTEGSKVFHYPTWLSNVPSSCCSKTENEGYCIQTASGACSWANGCVLYQSNLPQAAHGEKIVHPQVCLWGGNTGEYCCYPNEISTSSGCQACPSGQTANKQTNLCVSG